MLLLQHNRQAMLHSNSKVQLATACLVQIVSAYIVPEAVPRMKNSKS
jgi:hypothetical protein